jgi:hypothetical protein
MLAMNREPPNALNLVRSPIVREVPMRISMKKTAMLIGAKCGRMTSWTKSSVELERRVRGDMLGPIFSVRIARLLIARFANCARQSVELRQGLRPTGQSFQWIESNT